ncbi:RING/U-box superfamily protein [Carex rostrata]
MGSGSSKNASLSGSNLNSRRQREGSWKEKGKIGKAFISSCFGLPPTLPQQSEEKNEGLNNTLKHLPVNIEVEENSKNNGVDFEKFAPSSSQIPHSINVEASEESHNSTLRANSEAGEVSPNVAANIPRARFNITPGTVSFRLNRAVSLGSSTAHDLFSSNAPLSNPDREVTASSSDQTTPNETNPTPDFNARAEEMVARLGQRNLAESERNTYRNRRTGNQETLEGSVRFSRTLSVGRLRDRVLRRTPFSDGLFSPVLLDETAPSASRALSGIRRAGSLSNRVAEMNLELSSSLPFESGEIPLPQNLQHTDANNQDLLERRSAFIERRRRIRSQVRALQRLGSRFENLSGHERSCILAGRHRTGQCNCRTRNRSGNPDDETSTRASISRIVMLAEALFEVLDEIHQQSMVLSSSRPSFSSIGSVPAPKETVESLPVKMYRKPAKHSDEAAQCYICLVEYEEGDCMRVLPCSHEFHLTCIDKWLKEIHRVCPLCRGDVCRAEASSVR